MEMTTLRYAIRATLPVAAGYLVLGAGFGILMQSYGYSWYWPVLMSTCIYAGSMQFIAVDLLSSGANLLSIVFITIAVNARHIFYGLTMLLKYRDMKRIKPYLIFSLTDETYSLVCNDLPNEINDKQYYMIVSLLNQGYWVFGTIIGVILGSNISFNSSGIEFSMTALFTITMIEQWEISKNHFPAIVGLVVSILCRFIFSADHFLIPSMILITILLMLNKKPEKGDVSYE